LGGSKAPELPNLNPNYFPSPSHFLESFRVDSQKSGGLTAVEQRLEFRADIADFSGPFTRGMTHKDSAVPLQNGIALMLRGRCRLEFRGADLLSTKSLEILDNLKMR
jgi:hypothetical protein